MPMTALLDSFLAHAADRPNADAIIESRRGRDQALSFAGLDERSERAASFLRETGVRPGMRVLVLHSLSIELYVSVLALFRLGATVVLIDPGLGKPAFEQAAQQANCAAIIADWRLGCLRWLRPSLRRISLGVAVGGTSPGWRRWSRYRKHPADAHIEPVPANHPALLTFTSGSTGQPKGIVRSHGFLLQQRAALAETLALHPGQRDLTTLPVFVLANLACGVTTILAEADLRRPGFIDPHPVLRQIERLKPTRSTAAPAFFQRLLDAAHGHPRALAGFKRIDTGGGPVTLPFLQALDQACSGADTFALYGSTEAEPIARLAASHLPEPPASVSLPGLPAGQISDHLSCRIIADQWGDPIPDQNDSTFAKMTLPPGQ
ncbi:MAG: AMP-binding protein, partial [Verrucomicrobiota bacterium]